MDKLVNLEILRNPVNWLVVISILIFMAFCGFTIWNAVKGNLEV